MLKRDPPQRLTLSAICVHPWLTSSPRISTPLSAPNLSTLLDSHKKVGVKNIRFTPKMPLVCLGRLTDDDHSYIVQKMVDGKIAKRDEIMQLVYLVLFLSRVFCDFILTEQMQLFFIFSQHEYRL